MDCSVLVDKYPYLYHMAENGMWDSLQQYGLLSTSKLLDMFEIEPSKRVAIESDIRPQSVTITHPHFGCITIRDNKPMRRDQLELTQLKNGEPCLLDNLTPRQWCEMLNERVFFWLSYERLLDLLKARAYRGVPHLVLTIDTAPLVRDYYHKIELSPINSGCTLPYPQASRGLNTFLPISDYPYDTWKKKRRTSMKAVVELTVKGGVPNIKQYVLKADKMQQDTILETLYTR